MESIEEIGNESLPSVINNPFQKNKITHIHVWCGEKLFDKGKWDASGTVKFKNGNTEG
jgi:hypothetical protein